MSWWMRVEEERWQRSLPEAPRIADYLTPESSLLLVRLTLREDPDHLVFPHERESFWVGTALGGALPIAVRTPDGWFVGDFPDGFGYAEGTFDFAFVMEPGNYATELEDGVLGLYYKGVRVTLLRGPAG